MRTTVDLLDLARSHQGGVSDYKIAQLLGISTSQISNYRCGRARPANSVAMRLGELCGIDPLEAVACVNLERFGAEDEREVWRLMLARLAQDEEDFLAQRPAIPLPKRDKMAYR